MELIDKVKTWYNKNKDEIKKKLKIIGGAGACLGAGYLLGHKISELEISTGIVHYHDKGVLKFFDPLTGNEVKTFKETCEVMKNNRII